MAVPTTEKTWEFSLYNFVNPQVVGDKGITDEGSCQVFYLAFLNFMTDKKKKGWGGTFTDQGGGTVRFDPTVVGGNPYGFSGNEKYDSSDVGLKIRFVGCNSAGNDGTFTITAVDTSAGAWCEFVNSGSPVFEVDTACDSHVLAGNFTTPLTVKGSSASRASRSYGMDGKDRWVNYNDYMSALSGSRDWVVLQTASGCEMLWWLDTSSTSYEYDYGVVGFSAENGFTGGTLSTSPTATDYIEKYSRTERWHPLTDPYVSADFYVSIMMSDDGEHFRLWINNDDNIDWFMGMERAYNAITAGSIPWNGNQNIFWYYPSNGTNVMLFGSFNDGSRVHSVIDKDAVAGGPYYTYYYMTCEMCIAAMIGQNMAVYPNQLSREGSFAPIGLATPHTSVRGRHGRMADIWWIGSGGSNYGSTFPFDGSKEFIRIGDFILPWDGASPYKQRV